MAFFILVTIIIIVGLFVYHRFSSYKRDRLLMFSMKTSHKYMYLYNSYKRDYPNLSKEELYIKVLGFEAINREDSEYSGQQTLSLVRNQLLPGQIVRFREIVKFLLIRKIFETSELNNLLETDDRSIKLYLKCALLPESEKAKTGDILKKNGFTPEKQHIFAQNLNSIETAVDTAIAEEQ